MTTPERYADEVIEIAGCTCHPRRVIQQLDDKGSFVVEHYHRDNCSKTLNSKLWKARGMGVGVPDVRTFNDRRSVRREWKTL